MEDSSPKLTFCGGVGTVTGANFLLEGSEGKVLVDCGIFQGREFAEEGNTRPFPYDPKEIDFLVVTHAHIDHIGRIPKLVREGFQGKIFSTAQTRATAPLMYEDALSIMRHELRNTGKKPLYEEKDASKALSMWEAVSYHDKTVLFDGISFMFNDAGHILGSATALFDWHGRKICFSGDLGNAAPALVRETEPVRGAEYMVIESVYGDRVHEKTGVRKQRLKEIVLDVVSRGGAVVIPAFSMERTQIILHELNDLMLEKEIPNLPVFLDSPLAIKLTEIYRNAPAYLFGDHAKKEVVGGDDIFDFPTLKLTKTVNDSREITSAPNPKIILAGSGMSVGGRVIHHERNFLEDSKSTILFVGYQAPKSLGRTIQDGTKKIEIDGKTVHVKAKIETIHGFSAHADRDKLLWFVEQSRETLKKVFVTMGEPKSSMFLAQRINDYLDVKAVVPEENEEVILD